MLFHYKKGQMSRFWHKRLISILVPWLVSASCVYFYVYLRKSPLSLMGWISFIIGNGSYCYYLTMLMMLYLIFTSFPFMRTGVALIVCEVITVISTIWIYQIGNLSPYLNILNWVGYFALGMQITCHKDKAFKPFNKLYKLRWTGILLYIAMRTFQIRSGNGGSYWKGINVIVCWSGAIALLLMAILVEKSGISGISEVFYIFGRDSFLFIYGICRLQES